MAHRCGRNIPWKVSGARNKSRRGMSGVLQYFISDRRCLCRAVRGRGGWKFSRRAGVSVRSQARIRRPTFHYMIQPRGPDQSPSITFVTFHSPLPLPPPPPASPPSPFVSTPTDASTTASTTESPTSSSPVFSVADGGKYRGTSRLRTFAGSEVTRVRKKMIRKWAHWYMSRSLSSHTQKTTFCSLAGSALPASR